MPPTLRRSTRVHARASVGARRTYDGRMQQVFVSSIQRDYSDVREAVRGAVESLGMRALMAESAGASCRDR